MNLIESLLIYLVVLVTVGIIIKLFQLWKENKLSLGL